MSLPANLAVHKIEVYDPTPTLRYTIYDAWNIRTTTKLNDVGTFSFNIDATNSIGGQSYPNIALNDTVKIYYGYGSVESTSSFVGKIYHIAGSSSDQGKIRVIKGKDQGEILQRRFHSMDDWAGTGASTIVTELANDLSLGTGDIVADATAETHRIDIDKHKQYYQLVKEISDYWVSAGSQVKKDFYVDADNDLVWKARPIRTSGVETFTVGANINSYNVMKDLLAVKNKIYVYGARGKPHDASKDVGTEIAADPNIETTVDANSASGQKVLNVTATADFSVDDKVWINGEAAARGSEYNQVASIQAGVSLTMTENLANSYAATDQVVKYPGWVKWYGDTAITVSATARIGSNSIKIEDDGAPGHVGAGYIFDEAINLNYYPQLNFFLYLNENTNDPHVGWVHIKDGSYNSAIYELPSMQSFTAEKWTLFQIACGRDYEDNWEKTGSLDWTDITQCGVIFEENILDLYIDGLYAGNRRFSDTAEDSTSQTSYGVREMWIVDDNLASNSQCESRGEALIYQLKDPITRIDLEVEGNTNVLIGDQLTLTIPAEGISAASYDVTEVTHHFAPPFKTYISAMSTSNSRRLPIRTEQDYLVDRFRRQFTIGGGTALQM